MRNSVLGGIILNLDALFEIVFCICCLLEIDVRVCMVDARMTDNNKNISQPYYKLYPFAINL